MKLTWLLRLYPRAWRRRYEAEFVALLEHHPTSPRLILDIILGAVDAHLWPQVSAAGCELAAKAAGGESAMLSEEYRGAVRIDPSMVIGLALVATFVTLSALMFMSPESAESVSVFHRYVCDMHPEH